GVWFARRVSGCASLGSRRGGDITRVNFFDLLSLVGVHLEKAADSLSFPLGRIVNARPGGQRPGIDSEEAQRSDKRIGHNLKSKSRKWRLILRRPFAHGVRIGIEPFDGWNIQRRG